MLYDRVKDIHDWIKYAPHENQYARQNTNVIFAAIKITDLYNALSTARANLHYAEQNSFGDICSDDAISIQYIRSQFMQNALIYYNIAVDFSWQVLWVRYNGLLSDMLATTKLFEKSTEDCCYQELLLGLTLRRDTKMREIVSRFFDGNTYYKEIRPMYNYIKHRGTYYFKGLGINDTVQMYQYAVVNKDEPADKKVYNIPKVARRIFDLKKVKNTLENFDKDFIEYCENLIHLVIPYDYYDKCSFGEIYAYISCHWNEIIEFNKFGSNGIPVVRR